jgi:glycerol-3-phosphate dehydrogenase
MFKKLIKFGIGINLLCLGGGYLNSKFGYNPDNNKLLLDLSDSMKDNNEFLKFDKQINDFVTITHPEHNPIKHEIPTRKEMLDKLKNEKFEILVIGGGCSGAGVLLSGYHSGLKCGLIEGADFGSGTSSRSSKLIHGGIRYLQDVFSFGSSAPIEKLKLVFEALKERDFLLNSAPFLNNLIEIKIPCSNLFYMDYYFSGVLLYHFLYVFHSLFNLNLNLYTLPGPRIQFSNIQGARIKFVSFFEGQMFDSRQCLLSILSCCCKNSTNSNKTSAVVSNYIEFKEYITDPTGKITAIKAYDTINREEFIIKSDLFINCTGIYGDVNLSKNDANKNKLITTSKGAHVIVKNQLFNKLGYHGGYMVPKTSDGRVLYVLPYQNDYFMIGTTDTEMEKSCTPFVEDIDVKYILSEITKQTGITESELKSQITSKWAGLRPLVRSPDSKHQKGTKSIARNHVIIADKETGLISLLGGKWTTYRQMGEDVITKIKEVAPELFKNKNKNSQDCSNIKLLGGYHFENVNKNISFYEEKKFYAKLAGYLKVKYGFPQGNKNERLFHDLVSKYGINSIKILEINKTVPDGEKFITGNILKAELIYCINNEMAVRVNDFICRRSGLGFVEKKLAVESIEKVAEVMGKELKWSRNNFLQEIQFSKDNIRFLL